MLHTKALDALKRAATRTFEHYKGKIQQVNEIRREKDRQMQHDLDVNMGKFKEKDSTYMDFTPKRRHEVMNVGRRIVK